MLALAVVVDIKNVEHIAWPIIVYLGYKKFAPYSNYLHLALLAGIIVFFYKFIFKLFISLWFKMIEKNS